MLPLPLLTLLALALLSLTILALPILTLTILTLLAFLVLTILILTVLLVTQLFFKLLLDWLAEDTDLLELQTKTAPDRTIDLMGASGAAMVGQPDTEAIRERESLLKWLNVALPFGAIMVIWLVVAMRRRARKQAFVASVQQ